MSENTKMDIVEMLSLPHCDYEHRKAAAEIKRLRAALRELIDAIDGPVYSAKRAEEARSQAHEALGEDG